VSDVRTCNPNVGVSSVRRLCSPKAAATRLNTTAGTMAKWRCAGVGPAYVKIRGRIYYDIGMLDAFIDASVVRPACEGQD
jgi:hypothetical protein